jgi:hypothetical protein
MNANDLAMATALEFGEDVAHTTGLLLSGAKPRSLGMTDVLVVATFVVQCAQLAVQIYGASIDRASLITKIENAAPMPAEIDAPKRKAILERIIANLLHGGQ